MRLLILSPLCCALAVAGCLDAGGGTAATEDATSATDTTSTSATDTTTVAVADTSAPADTASPADTATPADTSIATDTTSTDASGCFALGTVCGASSQCCGDAFCPAEASYNEGVCTAPLADGEVCYVHDWCASGVCNGEGTCGAPKCADDQGECWYDDACCSGACFYEVSSPYVPGSCGAPLPNGSVCSRDSWCASGRCLDSVCAALDCKALDAACQDGGDCCSGICSNEVHFRYGSGTCLDRLPAGSVCYNDVWCQSLSCSDEFTCTEF